VHLPPVLSLRRHPRRPRPCRCGHLRDAHEHYRSGTDCALCACPRFRAAAGPAKPPPDPPATEPGGRVHFSEPRLVA
jgi:hypothetical protein